MSGFETILSYSCMSTIGIRNRTGKIFSAIKYRQRSTRPLLNNGLLLSTRCYQNRITQNQPRYFDSSLWKKAVSTLIPLEVSTTYNLLHIRCFLLIGSFHHLHITHDLLGRAMPLLKRRQKKCPAIPFQVRRKLGRNSVLG